jgi:hypothetical protein
MDENKDVEIGVEYFSKMVKVSNDMNKPWIKAFFFSNALWATIVLALILLAYLVPSEISANQEQDFPNQTQSQEVEVTN